jgi:dTDP-4-dehydrorhamnose 3,5-epimerase
MNTTFKPTEENKINNSVYKTAIDGLFYIPHKYNPDDRGFYSELARTPEIDELTGNIFTPKQFNQSRSNTNVIRGIHAEDWNKLVSVTNGACFCALVDLRKNSPTFGKSETLLLGTTQESLRGSIFISKGIGNSFCVVEGPADYIYAVDAIWAERDTSNDVSINLFDPDINIQWPIQKDNLIVSQRDLQAVNLKDL